MLIGIDGNEANVLERVGVGEYAFELLKQFSKFKVRSLKFKVYLKEKPQEDLPQETDSWEYRIIGPRRLWTQIGLPLALYKDCRYRGRQINVFWTPTHYAPRFCPCPRVISIFDLSFIHYPQMFKKSDLYQLKNWTSYSVKKASKILTISKASKDDIIKIYGIPREKVVVTYPGIKLKAQSFDFAQDKGSKLKSMEEIQKKYGIGSPYILFVGTLQPRKNIARLIEAFSKIISELRSPRQFEKSSNASVPASSSAGLGIRSPSATLAKTLSHVEASRSLELVIVGKKGWLYESILQAPKKFGVEDSVKFLDFVVDEDLPLLYQNALCFVLPSLYEGFGLPVLEAMSYGCPVITSNVSSLPEAGGEATLYVDPEDVNDLASKIKLLLKDENLRRELIEKGFKQAKKFSWEKTARETLKVLEEVANKKY